MPHPDRHVHQLAAGALAALVVMTACGGDDGDATAPTTPAAIDDAAAAQTSATSATTPPTPPSTSAPSTAPPSSASTSSAPPTTAAASSVPGVSGGDGTAPSETSAIPPTPPATPAPGQLGSIRFVDPDEPTRSASVFGFEYGTSVEPDDILSTVGGVLDGPDHDSGWQAMPASISCKDGIEYRSILWDDLRVVLERRDGGATRLGAWSVGDVALEFSPPLAAQIAEPSGVTSASGLGIGSPTPAIAEEGFPMVGIEGDRTLALTGVSPVVFEMDDGVVAAFSIEDNDCLADTDDM